MYRVKSIFYTLQGEGANAGRPAVFIRFAGCNLWSGRDEDRDAGCSAWCDTDFRGGEKLTTLAIVERAVALWPGGHADRFAVLTGGEPMLQVDTPLVDHLHRFGFAVAVETNGTKPVPDSVDWITVSPKAGAPVVQTRGQELKVVWPQEGLDLDATHGWSFARRYLSPLDNAEQAGNVDACVNLCLADPRWRLSLQTHKLIGVP